MALGESYGAKDVWHDRNYLLALMQRRPNDPLRQVAEKQLESLDREDALTEQKAYRTEQTNTRRDIHDENVAARMAAVGEAEKGRNERAGIRADLTKQAQADKKTQGLVAAMNTLSYDQTPEGKKALANVRAEYLKDIGIGENVGAPTKTVGDYGPGGAEVKTQNAAVDTAKEAFSAPATPSVAPTQPFAYGPVPFDSGPSLASNALARAPKTVNPDGTVTTHLPSGGTATAYDTTTPEGVVAINSARKESARLAGIPFTPVTQTRSTAAANVPTNENVQPNPVPYALPNVVANNVSQSIPVGLQTPTIVQPSAAPTPAPGTLAPSVFGNVNFNTGVAPAPTPGLPSPVPTPTPALTPEQLALLKKQQNPYQ